MQGQVFDSEILDKYEEELRDCEAKLDLLNQSKDSIQQTAEFFMSQTFKHPSLSVNLVQLWMEKAVECPPKRKICFMFLANDIIQRSKMCETKIKNKEYSFCRQFEKVIVEMFSKLTSIMCKEKKYYNEYMKEVNKIIKVWSERSTFPTSIIDSINQKIQEVIQTHEKALQEKITSRLIRDPTSGETISDSKIAIDKITMNGIQEQWVELAEILNYQQELDTKIAKLEEELDQFVVNIDIVDEIDFECKIDEIKKLHQQSLENKRILLGFTEKVFAKTDNQMFQSILMMKNIDDSIAKVNMLKNKLL